MNWAQLVKAVVKDVAETEGVCLKPPVVSAVMKAMVKIIKQRVIDGDVVKVLHLGIFKTVLRKETCRRGGIHGKSYVIPQRVILSLRVYRPVNAMINARCRGKRFADQPD